MVVFKDGKADKKSYRHFTIKHTLEITKGKEPNDFEMMREVYEEGCNAPSKAMKSFCPCPTC
jgi:excinuclease UvrABC nuclease subunit